MADDVINVGAAPDDGNGDTIRVGAQAVNLIVRKENATTGAELVLREVTTGGTSKVTLTPGVLTADRVVTLGDVDVTLDQDLSTTATVGFANLSGTNTGDEVAASETVAGVAEIATQVETDAGTDDLRFVTPLKLATYPFPGGGPFDAGDAATVALDATTGGLVIAYTYTVPSGANTTAFTVDDKFEIIGVTYRAAGAGGAGETCKLTDGADVDITEATQFKAPVAADDILLAESIAAATATVSGSLKFVTVGAGFPGCTAFVTGVRRV